MSNFKKIVIVLVVIAIGVMAFFYFGVYSEGTRAGVIMKVSKKGVIFKTWEGQMNLETFGSIKSDNIVSETFSFSIEKGNQVLFDKLNDAALSGNRVNLKYIERYSMLFFRGDTKYFAVGIEESVVNQNKEKNEDLLRR
jgi:hypothetical protein